MADDLFEPVKDGDPVEDPTFNPLEDLVGEGKKFKSVDDLARGKVESDRFIKKLQDELREMREDLNQRLALEQIVDKIESKVNPGSPASTQSSYQEVDERETEHTAQNMTPEQIEEIVLKSVTKQKEVDTQKQNIDKVRAELEKVWGSRFADRLEEKTSSLGLGKDFATGLAATHPQAFLKLMLDKGEQAPSTAPAQSSYRPASQGRHGPMRYKEYQKVRQENPSLYHSAKFQLEMHNAAMAMGEDFYN